MNSQVQIVSILGSALVMLLVFHLIRRRKLREEYALLWFGASLVLILVAVWRDSLEYAARLLGVAYPPSVLLLGVIAVGFLLAMHYSVSLSQLAEQNQRLAQELALLRHDLERAGGRNQLGANQLGANQLGEG
ncbi:MAG TPA: DUF2304 domain-containing protein [Blastocatellia bacterium]|jgi:hypothetical protein|nr:DUF2304 domain-containing protein [Blastocatellia bacterium]